MTCALRAPLLKVQMLLHNLVKIGPTGPHPYRPPTQIVLESLRWYALHLHFKVVE